VDEQAVVLTVSTRAPAPQTLRVEREMIAEARLVVKI
jgi:hypothetical protein